MLSILITALLVFLADQASKSWVKRVILPRGSIPIIPGIFHFSFVQNTGAAFGILKGKTLFFTIAAALVIITILWSIPHLAKEHHLVRIAVGFLMGGALGNLFDRVRHGYVVDFIDFRIWPVFNLADIAIVLGVAFFFWRLVLCGSDR